LALLADAMRTLREVLAAYDTPWWSRSSSIDPQNLSKSTGIILLSPLM
jgi:hypothetical protein